MTGVAVSDDCRAHESSLQDVSAEPVRSVMIESQVVPVQVLAVTVRVTAGHCIQK